MMRPPPGQKGEAIAPLGNIRPAKMFMDQNEKLYFGGFDQENYTFHLWTVQEDGTVQELLPEVFKIQEGRSYGVIPDFIGIGPGGDFGFRKLGGECLSA